MTLAVDDAVRDDLEDEHGTVVAVWLVLQEADEPLTTADIAAATTFSMSATKRALRALLDRGLISRRPDLADRRRPVHEAEPPTDGR
ncbi:MarR family transcriptional regulator [Haloferax volcanii]|uniref:MarR family transcriptional regulator n=1 Tax=Haloferax volcanii TaxID=2246 RepID=UPI00249CC051|nr:MarR family transcriptional regulator [Haloferax alexandrinus]WEL29872.1 MarR family transcriptional regulator [Haloferax alexandrinus]